MTTQQSIDRRRMLGLIAGAGAVALGACTNKSDNPTRSGASDSASTATSPSTSETGGGVGEIPSETAGPFPGDGTTGDNVLTQPGIVRRDIRTSLSGGGVAEGVGLELAMKIVDAATGRPLPGAAVYIWQCDREALYSMYSPGATDETYLRGVQVADSSGALSFTSIFPAAYDGRWPHVHFEVFDTAQRATNGRNSRKISQLALPEATCREVYATSAYESSRSNLTRTPLTSDIVFRGGTDLHLATATGSVGSGYTASLVVGV